MIHSFHIVDDAMSFFKKNSVIVIFVYMYEGEGERISVVCYHRCHYMKVCVYMCVCVYDVEGASGLILGNAILFHHIR